MRPSRKKVARLTAFSILLITCSVVAYLLLICHPGLLFPHALQRGGITLYSDEPIPAEPAGRIVDEVEYRLVRSPLATPPRIKDIRIYICNRTWRFVLFANVRYNVGGLAYSPLSDNIFLRAVRFDSNRLIGPSGNEVPGARTLSYFITHEIVHTLLARELGAVKFWQLPAWKNEGYADFVAKGRDFDYERVREQFRSGDRELDPARSGLYLRYHLLVAFLLEQKRIGLDDLLRREESAMEVEAEVLAKEPMSVQ
jgi:hypothetical protein